LCAVEQAEQQKQLQQQAQQHAAPSDTQPCNPAAASPQHTTDSGHDGQPHIRCKPTAAPQLDAEGSEPEDSSTGNNNLRRVAAEIRQGSPTLQTTLDECCGNADSRGSSFACRSRHSDGSSDEQSTPVALPGRGWIQVGNTSLTKLARCCCRAALLLPVCTSQSMQCSSTHGVLNVRTRTVLAVK
jgi:hypothetical protein